MHMTEQLARRIAEDAATDAMKKAGRHAWSAEDYDVAIAEFNRLWPLDAERREP